MFNWREIPFVRLLLPFISGMLLAHLFNFNNLFFQVIPLPLLLFLLLLGRIRGWYRYRWIFGLVLSALLVLIGYHRTFSYDERNKGNFWGQHLVNEENIIIGKITDVPIKKEKWVRFELAVSHSGSSLDSLYARSGHILLYLPRDSAAERVKYGDLLYFIGRITEVEPPKNPHAFDYRRYLHFQNIHFQAFVRAGDWEVLGSGGGNPVFRAAILIQERFLQTLRRHLPGEKELAVGSALILGYRHEIPEELQTAYAQTGAMHVLAVSGLHVGIVLLILNFFLKRIGHNTLYWRLSRVVIALAGVWAFALVTGASPSVIRAAVMFSFLHVGIAFHRMTSIYNTLAASAFMLLMVNPFLLFSVSFQLSYLAVFGIVYFQPKFARLWIIEHKLGNYIWQLVCVSLAAQLMTLPLTFFYFNQFPTYFWLTSLILVPLAGVELGTGMLLLLLDNLWPGAALVTGKVLDRMLWIGNQSVAVIQQLPASLIDGIWIGGLIALLLYVIITSIMMAISSKKYNWVLTGLTFLLIIAIHYAFNQLRHHQRRQLVVYHIYKHTAIDLFAGKNVYALIDGNADEKALRFATEGHRHALGMDKLRTFHLPDTTRYEFKNCFIKNGFAQLFDTRLAIVNDTFKRKKEQKITVDYLIIRGTPKVNMVDWLARYDVKEKVIFDVSNKHWMVRKWKKACAEMKIDYHDVGTNGAFVMDL